MMWIGYSNENDENVKIIMMLRKNKKQTKKIIVTGLALSFKSSTCYISFRISLTDTPVGTAGNGGK